MKLIYRILIRLSVVLLLILSGWAVFFYYTMVEEINDEVDDALEDYSETIVLRALAGRELPSANDGTNNTYQIHEITKEEADSYPSIHYYDAEIYIQEKKETEPARILRTIFANNEGRYFLLEVSTPSFEKEDLRGAVASWIVFLYATLLVTLLIVCAWVFYRSLKPLYTLLHWLDGYLPGKPIAPLQNKTTISEFRRLNDAAQRAAKRSELAFNQQKQFIGNASHELQTPLAVCTNRIEWLLDNTDLTEEQMAELFKTKHTLNYIIRLNKSLLFLSRIDNRQFTESCPIEINNLVKRLLDDYKEIFCYNGLIVSLEESGIFTLIMNEALAEALISNLVKNAFIHNKENGYIHITLKEQSFVIANTGTDFPLDSEHIFDRFYQGSRKEESTGLGLAIADAICKQYQLHLSYEYRKGEHLFSLSK